MGLTQEDVRQRLINYVSEGVKMTYVSNNVNIPDYILCRFKHDKKQLYDESLKVLNEFLLSKGF